MQLFRNGIVVRMDRRIGMPPGLLGATHLYHISFTITRMWHTLQVQPCAGVRLQLVTLSDQPGSFGVRHP